MDSEIWLWGAAVAFGAGALTEATKRAQLAALERWLALLPLVYAVALSLIPGVWEGLAAGPRVLYALAAGAASAGVYSQGKHLLEQRAGAALPALEVGAPEIKGEVTRGQRAPERQDR